MGGWIIPGVTDHCLHCQRKVPPSATVCPHCHHSVDGAWYYGAPWFFPAVVGFIALLLTVILVDAVGQFGILEWTLAQLRTLVGVAKR